jgi:hypothetical protein
MHGVDHDVANCGILFVHYVSSRLQSTLMWEVVVHIIPHKNFMQCGVVNRQIHNI